MKTRTKLILLASLLVIPVLAFAEHEEGKDRPCSGERKHSMLEKADANNDKKISLVEFKDMWLKRAEKRFERLDENKDGDITEEEFRAGRERHRHFRKEHRRGEHQQGPRGHRHHDFEGGHPEHENMNGGEE